MTQAPVEVAARIAVQGAGGRMGQRLVALAEADPGLVCVGAFERGHPISAERLTDAAADVVIDFSSAAALPATLDAAVQAGSAVVIGTTGLESQHHASIDAASERIPVLEAANFSLVVNVLHDLTARAVAMLGDGWDLEIVEAHHRYKKDAPSGTALALARTLADAAGRSHEKIQLARHGEDAIRQPDDITVQALRIGDHPGEHTVHLAGLGERLELKHVATNRDSYARGALRAAAWLAQQPAGRYTMRQVLGL